MTRNEVLFYRLREMIPIVNDLTVGMAMEQHHHECRPPRGMYLSINHADGIKEAFADLGAAAGDIDLIIAIDAEQILGIGHWGVGGIEVPIGKLAIYTAAGGIDPTRVIPVMLDVGTNRQSLLDDPTYVGNRHARVHGARYDAFIDAYVEAVTALFPHALLQWEDFAPANGRRILQKYRDRICTFNDDMQGTGAIDPPIIFALSNPSARAEVNPTDLITWTEGRALVATGTAFAPNTYKAVTYAVAQVNNAMLYPDLGLGAVVGRARRISDGMFAAAAGAVSSLVAVRQPGASLLPHIDDLHSVSATVAMAVVEAAEAEGLAAVKVGDIVQQVQDAMWQSEYRHVEASSGDHGIDYE
jgi:malic enzyme